MPQWGTETILVVDDELVALSLTQLMLTRYGYSVLTASSGREALHLFEVWPDQHVHVAVIDIVMPEMDGFEVAAALRSIRPDLPVLFTSAYSDRPELPPEKTRNIPYLAKPFSSVKLIAKMREMLDKPAWDVMKMRSPQMIGVEVPRPASGVFQAMFFSALHSTGTFFSGEMPSAVGPRH